MYEKMKHLKRFNENLVIILPEDGSYTKINNDQFIQFNKNYKKTTDCDIVIQTEINRFFKAASSNAMMTYSKTTDPNRIRLGNPDVSVINIDLYDDNWIIIYYYRIDGLLMEFYLCDGEYGIIQFTNDYIENKNIII